MPDTRIKPAESAARALGYLLSPLTLPPLLVAFVLFFFRAPASELTRVTAVVFCLLTVTPSVVMLWMVRSGKADSLQVTDRRARTQLLALAMALAVATLIAVRLLGSTATGLLSTLIAVYLVDGALLLAINRFWKISLHAAAIAGCGAAVTYVGMAAWMQPHRDLSLLILLSASILAAVAVGWARLKENLHSPSQVAAGWAVGALTTLAQLAFAARLGILEGL